MAQMKQQMEAGNLIDAEALVFDSSEKPSSTSSPFFDNSGRRDDFTNLDFKHVSVKNMVEKTRLN